MSRHVPGYIQKTRPSRFRVRLCVGGQRFSYTVRTGDRREAEQFAKSKQAELERQFERRSLGFAGPVRVSELLDRFEREAVPTKSRGTQRAYVGSLQVLRAYFVDELGDPTLDRVRAADVQGFLVWRRAHPLKGAALTSRTIQKDRAVAHAVFAFADRLELRDGNPVARVPAPKVDGREPVILTDEQYEVLLAACDDPMLRMFVAVLGETGARCESEVLHLQFDDVDLEAGFLKIESGRDGHRTKTGKGRWVPLTPRLARALRDHFAAHRLACDSAFVFHHDRDRRHAQAGQRITSFRRAFVAAAKRAKLPAGFHQHDLRHRRVTTWLAQGRDVVKVKDAVGHSDLRTTMAYTHLTREHLRALVADEPAVAEATVPEAARA